MSLKVTQASTSLVAYAVLSFPVQYLETVNDLRLISLKVSTTGKHTTNKNGQIYSTGRLSTVIQMRDIPHGLMCLKTWCPVGGAVWGGYGTLRKWKKYVTGGRL